MRFKFNRSLTLLFWQIGKWISNHILQNKRAEYGKEIVVTVSRQLVDKYGRNYEEKNLRRMIQFAEKFSNYENVVTLSGYWTELPPKEILEAKLQDALLKAKERIERKN